MLTGIKNMNEVWQKRLFVLMTAAAIVPLYFENTAGIAGAVFLILLILLSIVSISYRDISSSKAEKGWVWASAIYALVFVISFLLRPPYTDDGIWRLSSPGFILLLLAWFWVGIKLQLGSFVIKSVAFSSIIFAVILLVAELYISGGWFTGYRYGNVLADFGKTGFYLPLTAFLFGILFLKERKKQYLALYLLAFLLSGLVMSRTALAMVTLPLAVTVIYFLFSSKNLSGIKKTGILVSSVTVIAVSMYLAKGKLDETMHDYKLAEQNNYYSSLGLRVAMFKVGSEMAEKYFLFGVGPNSYKADLRAYVTTTNYSEIVKETIPTFTHLHNQFLMDIVLSGVAGFVSLIMFIGYPVKLFWRLFRSGRREEAVFGIGFMAGLWFILLFGAIFTYTYTTILYVMTVGAMILFYRDDLGRKHG